MAEKAKEVMKKLKEEVEKKGLKLSVTENGEEGKSKMIASCGFMENELRQFSKEEGVPLADRGRWQQQLAKKVQPLCSYSWKHTAWKWKKGFPPWPLSIGQKESGLENAGANKKKRGGGKFKKFRSGDK